MRFFAPGYPIAGVDDLPLDSKAQFRLPKQWHDDFIANAKAAGPGELETLRALVKAFNDFCAGGRRPVFPLQLMGPAYVVEEGRVKDATYITKGEVGGPAETTIVPHAAQQRPSSLASAEAEEQTRRNAGTRSRGKQPRA